MPRTSFSFVPEHQNKAWVAPCLVPFTRNTSTCHNDGNHMHAKDHDANRANSSLTYPGALTRSRRVRALRACARVALVQSNARRLTSLGELNS